MVNRRSVGFTLIELLVALTILGLLLSIAVPRYFGSVSRAEEAVLRENLYVLRDALDKHHGDTGRYPDSLDELVARKYLRAVPVNKLVQGIRIATGVAMVLDRKSTRLNSNHTVISYAVFCLKKNNSDD